MTSLDFVKELVNAFNVSNYGSKVNTNFVVEGDNIVVKFNCGRRSAKRYLSQMARDLVREYYSDESVARYAFDLGSFPFHFDKEWLKYDGKTRITKLTVPIDSGVIFNLKVHFAEEFKLDVKNQVIKAIDEKHHLGKKHIEEILNASIGQVEIDSFSGYIKCLLFNSPNLQTYFIGALQEQIKKHGYNYSGFYDIDDNKVYFKDVENIGFVRSVTETSKKKTAYNFNLQGVGNLKVKAERYKGAMGELIFRLAGVSICGYYRDNFISEDRISNGDHFAFIPMVKEGNSLRYLNYMEANKINAKFSHDLFTNVRGQTKDTESNEFDEGYALSDRQIALLIPVIIENSVINKDGQIEIDPGLPRTLLAEASPTQEFPTQSQGVVKDSSRQGSEREEGKGGLFQLVPGKIDSSQSTGDQSQLSLSIPSPTAWNDSTFLNLEGSNEEPEKQQVTDESDRKSSDECSEAKSQDSKSPKKHGGGVQKMKKWLSSTFSKQYDVNLKRHDEGRGTTRSTPETPVTKKSSVSKLFSSFPARIRARSNPSSAVTSPTHEGGPEWQQRLNPDQREELRPFLSPELRKKLDSNSLSPEDEQLKHLLYTPSGQEKMKKNFESQELQLRRLAEAQLSSPDNSNRDSGFSSMGSPVSPVVQHKGSAPLKVTECSVQQVNSHSVERT